CDYISYGIYNPSELTNDLNIIYKINHENIFEIIFKYIMENYQLSEDKTILDALFQNNSEEILNIDSYIFIDNVNSFYISNIHAVDINYKKEYIEKIILDSNSLMKELQLYELYLRNDKYFLILNNLC